MQKNQWIAIFTAIVLFFVMYFGCDVKPGDHKVIEKKRLDNIESTSISSLLLSAKEGMSPKEAATIMSLEMELDNAKEQEAKTGAFKSLSSEWYRLNETAIAGHYAEKVAELENTEDAWSIAGTTFSICVQREQEPKVKDYCTDHAITSLEKAASLNPSNLQHQINLALVYAENPPQENPMKGVLMLVNLNKQNPESVAVLNQLGRLAIKTGQMEKAVERLSQAVKIEPENPTSNCLLGEALQGSGKAEQALLYLDNCRKLTSDN